MLFASGELGPDASSQLGKFVERRTSIGFVVHLYRQWFQLNVDHVLQHASYNDFSGGYRRHYRMLPPSFIECPATQKVLNEFKSAFHIPTGELVLAQVQSSHIDESNSVPDTAYNVHVNPPNVDQDEPDAVPMVSPDADTGKPVHLAVNGLKPRHKAEYSITGQGMSFSVYTI